MKGHRQRQKTIERIFDECGCRVERIYKTKRGNHYCVECVLPDGTRQKFFTSSSPSDHRGLLNFRAVVRRRAGLAKQHIPA